MPDSTPTPVRAGVTRREFVKTTALVAGASTSLFAAGAVHAAGSGAVRVGLIGCGGRGTGAAFNALEASPDVQIVALADVFRDRLDDAREKLATQGERAAVRDERCFVGFDAYAELLTAGGVDIVILATPPHFRSIHLAEAVKRGVNVFMEKPVAVDAAGFRSVMASAAVADQKKLSIVAGTQRRHEACYLAAMERIRDGAIGDLTGASCYWNMGGLWHRDQASDWSDMEWQLRNWLYFTWLSGDHIVEQHVHNLDVVNWAFGGTPVKAYGLGGRQVRTEPKYGHIFDHFAIEYEYDNGLVLSSQCRQIDGTDGRVEERIRGTKGTLYTRPGFALITGEKEWRFTDPNPNPYVVEHKDLIASVRGESPRLNEARTVATSTLTAIMGRTSCYTGKQIEWDAITTASMDLSPMAYEFGPMPVPEVAMPGRTPFV